jgi:hypothetical protein
VSRARAPKVWAERATGEAFVFARQYLGDAHWIEETGALGVDTVDFAR